jgi:hypothetical protein
LIGVTSRHLAAALVQAGFKVVRRFRWIGN